MLTDFVVELQRSGIAVSPQAVIDAAAAVQFVPLDNRDVLRSTLAATLLKSAQERSAFETTFDVFFAQRRSQHIASDTSLTGERNTTGAEQHSSGSDQSLAMQPHAFEAMVREALVSGDLNALRRIAQMAVELYAGIEAGRPVGISYYMHRTLRALNLDAMVEALGATGDAATSQHAPLTVSDALGAFGDRLVGEEYRERVEQLRRLIEQAIAEALIAERGAEAVAASLRKTALSDIDFVHATRQELAAIRHALYPLARLLAARLARKRRHRRRGPLDFRSTIRRSLSTGGVPIEPRFLPPHPAKPELIVIADVSGSVASFARFTIQLVYAIAEQFSKVQSYVFVDGLDDVTTIFRRSTSLAEAIDRIAIEADVTHKDGHSDYGHALSIFSEKYMRQITARSEVLILGDARNNYHAPRSDIVAEIARRSRHLYWLNPEPQSYWGSGDSIISEYAPHCDAVYECRNLRQLEAFVSELG